MRDLPQEGLDIEPGLPQEILTHLVRNDLSLLPDRLKEADGERARTTASLDDGGARKDVPPDQDGRDVLRVEDLGAPLHLEDVLGKGGAKSDKEGPSG